MKAQVENNISDLSDKKLIEFYLSENNDIFFEELINRYSERIYATAYRIIRDHHKSEEVLQEVFLILTRKIDTFRADAKFSTWIYRIAMNVSYGYLRTERKHKKDISLEDYSPYNNNGLLGGKVESTKWRNISDSIILSKESIDIIEKAINELPEKMRIIFHLRHIELLSHKEISEILSISVSCAKSRLHRARLFVRDNISDYFYERRE